MAQLSILFASLHRWNVHECTRWSDRKSTRLNSSHSQISYAVFCLKKKLEQSMLATELTGQARTRGFGTYNAVATAAGSVGALAAGGPELLLRVWPGAPIDQRLFLLFVPVALAGAAVAGTLSSRAAAEPRPSGKHNTPALRRSRPAVFRLAGLFALDSFGGGVVVQSFIVYWLAGPFPPSICVLRVGVF